MIQKSTLVFAEADVNTATPSLGNAAATWAGWAVTAVTAKFYRSQSDTVKSVNPIASKMLSKPGSLGETSSVKVSSIICILFIIHLMCFMLEQPSSSSISTTTSSVTSMTSLEHEEGSRGNESVSDYDYNHWDDNENWGDMEVSLNFYIIYYIFPKNTETCQLIESESYIIMNNNNIQLT